METIWESAGRPAPPEQVSPGQVPPTSGPLTLAGVDNTYA